MAMQSFSKQKVSLRGASAKEITRDALLEKAAQERALRSEARRAASAALLIQRVWRGRHAACKAADNFRDEWDAYLKKDWKVLEEREPMQALIRCVRPFLYFAGSHRFCLHKATNLSGDYGRFVTCFTILLQSISSSDADRNYCSLSIGPGDWQSTWMYQARKLLRLCCVVLVEASNWKSSQVAMLASLAVRLLVALTDANLWKCFMEEETKARARVIVQSLLDWIAHGNADFYPALRTYIFQSCPWQYDGTGQPLEYQKEKLFVTASAITVALRPLQGLSPLDEGRLGMWDKPINVNERNLAGRRAAEVFCSCILTIPFITQRFPAVILPALQHPSVLTPCLEVLATSQIEWSGTDCFKVQSKGSDGSANTHACNWNIPPSAWALSNIVTLALGSSFKASKQGECLNGFVKGLVCYSYVRAACSLLKQMTHWIDDLQIKMRAVEKDNLDEPSVYGTDHSKVCEHTGADGCPVVRRQFLMQLEPMCQQWHLKQLLDYARQNHLSSSKVNNSDLGSESCSGLTLSDVAMLYSSLLTTFTVLNELRGPCPVLNLLAFAPGFLPELLDWLDNDLQLTQSCYGKISSSKALVSDASMLATKSGTSLKDDKSSGTLSTRWASAVLKIKGKASSSETSESDIDRKVYKEEPVCNNWDVEALKKGPAGIPEKTLPVLFLFCAAYGHLLMILDDEEFYERQVPFTLKQQRVIAASLNTLVYNGFFSTSKQNFTSLMEAAIKCLNSLYGRDCRHNFCQPSLWLAPGMGNLPAIPAAARAHEVAMASCRMGDLSQGPAIGYVLKMIPHVIPFEERVQIFREFIKADKMSRKMAGEAVGSGPGSIEIAVRRDRLVEDAFSQLNSLGARLKSDLNVSFVNEHGLPEAGLDYGGLFKEFLTDLAKAAFDPGYGLFIQTATEDGLLFPHPAAANLQHGLRMIEFLGRIVGKALYEGILLEYSFSHVFIWKLLGRYIFLDELSMLDRELHQSLMYLKRYEGDVKDLSLDFTITEEVLGRRTVVELITGGANIQVENDNKLQYVHAVADYKLNRQMQPLIYAFARGLSDLIAPAWLSLFNAKELNQLLSGGEHDFDIDDLKANTKYTGGFTENSRTVKQFWEVVKEFQPQERCALLKFVTSCSRAPLLGFKHLQPAFTIHKVTCDTPLWAMIGGQDVDRLPSASTCYNTLKLPTYKRISTMRTKLKYAIQANAGFELS